MSKTTWEKFEQWFRSQCDGDWEHGDGVTIESIDNPGWRISIGLAGTPLDEKVFDPVEINRTPIDWLVIRKSNDERILEAFCGVSNLEECLKCFLDWSETG